MTTTNEADGERSMDGVVVWEMNKHRHLGEFCDFIVRVFCHTMMHMASCSFSNVAAFLSRFNSISDL